MAYNISKIILNSVAQLTSQKAPCVWILITSSIYSYKNEKGQRNSIVIVYIPGAADLFLTFPFV